MDLTNLENALNNSNFKEQVYSSKAYRQPIKTTGFFISILKQSFMKFWNEAFIFSVCF